MIDASAVEREFFRALNPLVEPWVRAGCVSPSHWPFGVVVIETTGRRSGESRTVPVLAMLVDGYLIVGTVRGERSDWFQNLQVTPEVCYWLDGESRKARAIAFAPDLEEPLVEDLPPTVQSAVFALRPGLEAGFRFAVLSPR